MFSNCIYENKIRYKYALGMRDIIGREHHPFHEIMFLQSGDVNFATEDGTQLLKPGTVIVIPKECMHRYDPLCSENEYCRSVLQFEAVCSCDSEYTDALKKITVIKNSAGNLTDILSRMNKLTLSGFEKRDRSRLFFAYFTELMINLKYNSPDIQNAAAYDPTVSKILSYIDEHYSEPITVDSIANYINFSRSAVSHRFRETMHTSVYSYILNKKLKYAHDMIQGGTPATEVSYRCGFSDYSAFYKMYKKYFGFSPSKTGAAGKNGTENANHTV